MRPEDHRAAEWHKLGIEKHGKKAGTQIKGLEGSGGGPIQTLLRAASRRTSVTLFSFETHHECSQMWDILWDVREGHLGIAQDLK